MNLSEPILPPSSHLPVGSGVALAPGALLEHFEVSEVLAQTDASVLYLAHHDVDRHGVVVKEYFPAALAARREDGRVHPLDSAMEHAYHRGLESFIAEALALSQFDHPHLLHVSRVWEANGTAYRTMPLLEGDTLRAVRQAADVPFTQKQLTGLRDGLLGALEVLHDAGLAHGRVKPTNIHIGADGRAVLMDFSAVGDALSSNLAQPHADAFSDADHTQELISADLQAVAAVLHFALSGHWKLPGGIGKADGHEPLAETLARLRGYGAADGYDPDFLAAVDHTLSLPPARRLRSVAELRSLFHPRPAEAPATAAAETPGDASPAAAAQTPTVIKPAKRPKPPPPEREYALNPTESVLNLLAGFEQTRRHEPDDIELFESPVVPTLTEEAEPALPPMRTSLFDAMDAGVDLPPDTIAHRHLAYRPMPRIPTHRWRRYAPALAFGALVVAGVGALGWLLLS